MLLKAYPLKLQNYNKEFCAFNNIFYKGKKGITVCSLKRNVLQSSKAYPKKKKYSNEEFLIELTFFILFSPLT